MFELILRLCIYIYNIFKRSTVFVESQTTCREIFSKDIMKRPFGLGLGNFFYRWLGSCLGCLDSRDPKWSQLKKIFKPLFDAKPDMSIVYEWEADLSNLFGYNPISIDKLVNNLPLNFILRIIFGKTFVSEHKQDIDIIKCLSDELMYISFNHKYSKYAFYRFLPTEINGKLSLFSLKWENLLRTARHSQQVMDEGIYHELLNNYQTGGTLGWEYFSQTLIEVSFANQDVTSPSLAWLLVNYSLHPCTSSQNFIEESARMTPVAKYSMPKITTKELTISGKLYKAGTTVIVNFEALGKSSDWKMDDLHQFNPDRFNNISQSDFVGKFGYGAHKCPGNKLANQLFTEILDVLSSKWMLIPTSSSPTTDPTKAFITPIFNVYLLPKSYYSPDLTYYNCSPYAEIKENAFMAISVNNRSPFLSDSSLALRIVLTISQRNQNKQVLILICDEIAKYNLQAFDHCNAKKAILEAEKIGNKFISIFEKSIKDSNVSNVILVRWNQIYQASPGFTNPSLLNRVTNIAKRFIEHRGQGTINSSYQSKIELVKQYILNEILVLVNGVHYKGIHYRVLYYCGTKDHLTKFAGSADSLHNLILSIGNDPELKDVLDMCTAISPTKTSKCQGFIGITV